jgi:hypothetical protein
MEGVLVAPGVEPRCLPHSARQSEPARQRRVTVGETGVECAIEASCRIPLSVSLHGNLNKSLLPFHAIKLDVILMLMSEGSQRAHEREAGSDCRRFLLYTIPPNC